jgi:hypothetical protein
VISGSSVRQRPARAGPAHGSLLTVAADDRLLGISAVTAIDTGRGRSGLRDPRHLPRRCLISIADVWALTPSLVPVPSPVHAGSVADHTRAASMDTMARCAWSLASGPSRSTATVASRGVWWGDGAAGLRRPGQAPLRRATQKVARVQWLASSPDHRTLVVATADSSWRSTAARACCIPSAGVPHGGPRMARFRCRGRIDRRLRRRSRADVRVNAGRGILWRDGGYD